MSVKGPRGDGGAAGQAKAKMHLADNTHMGEKNLLILKTAVEEIVDRRMI